jgi:Flp pilus assembly protein TadD
MVNLARAYASQSKAELAEGILRSATGGKGWDSAEAWYLLGSVQQQMQRHDKAKQSLWYALELEGTQPIRPFHILD